MKKSRLEEGKELKVYCTNGVVHGKLVKNGSHEGEGFWYLNIIHSENQRLNVGENIKISRPNSSIPAASCIDRIEQK